MRPRVVVLSLASDFGCQVQMTNIEDDLLAVLGLVDLAYWQLATTADMPEEYDVAVIEGAVTTKEHVELVRRVRDTADAVIALGACAVTGGIPALATAGELEERVGCVYGVDGPHVACGRISPMPVTAVIDVDYHVPGCPIDPGEFVAVLHRALMGLSDRLPAAPLCAACKMAENVCFYDRADSDVCLGVLTRTGCGARCVTLGRPCTGCRGLAEDASMDATRTFLAARGIDIQTVLDRYRLYNTLGEVGRS